MVSSGVGGYWCLYSPFFAAVKALAKPLRLLRALASKVANLFAAIGEISVISKIKRLITYIRQTSSPPTIATLVKPSASLVNPSLKAAPPFALDVKAFSSTFSPVFQSPAAAPVFQFSAAPVVAPSGTQR